MNTATTKTYDALVAMIRTIRAEWSVDMIRKAVRDTLDADPAPTFPDLANALLNIALDAKVRNPSVLALNDHHWSHDDGSDASTRARQLQHAQRVAKIQERIDVYPADDVAAAMDRARSLRPDDQPDGLVVHRTALDELEHGFTAEQSGITRHPPATGETTA